MRGFATLKCTEVLVALFNGFNGLLDKFRQGLRRTQEMVLRPLGHLLGLRKLDEDQLLELEDLLLQADLGHRWPGHGGPG